MKNIRQTGIVLLLLAAFLCTSCGNSARAAVIQLIRTEGSVDVTDDQGAEIAPVENGKLYSGYNVETLKESYAWINLDSAKLTKMSAESEIEIQQSGKQLEILVNAGSLYFNVTEPLTQEETFTIRTATMAVGIRGTCGWVEVTAQPCMRVYILEGTVECSVTDETGEERTAAVSGGEMAEITAGEVKISAFQESAVPAFVLEELLEDEELYRKIQEDSGLEISGMTLGDDESSGKDGENTDEQTADETGSEEQGQTAGGSEEGTAGETDSGNEMAGGEEESGGGSVDGPDGIWAPDKGEWNEDYTASIASLILVEQYTEFPEGGGGMISWEEMANLPCSFRQHESGIWCYQDRAEQLTEQEYGEMTAYNLEGYEWRILTWGITEKPSDYGEDNLPPGIESTYWSADAENSRDWTRVDDSYYSTVNEEEDTIIECFNEYGFTVAQDGRDYTECRFLEMTATVTTNERYYAIILVRVPKEYDGAISFIISGNKEEDGELVINREERVVILF